MGKFTREKNGETLSSNHRAHSCDCVHRRLRVHTDVYPDADADHHVTNADCAARYTGRLTVNRHFYHRTADIHRIICDSYKSTANCNRAPNGGC